MPGLASAGTARSRPRAEDDQPSEALAANRRPTQPPTVFPLSQVPTGPRALQGSANAPQGFTAGGWATRGQQSGAPPATSAKPAPPHSTSTQRSRTFTAGSWADPASGTGKGKAVEHARAPTRILTPSNPRPTLFVHRLPTTISDADLRATFSPYGALTRISIKPPAPGAPHTFAHVAFSTAAEALAAYEALDGRHPTLLSGSSAASSSSSSNAGGTQGMKIQFAQTDEERDAARRAPPPPAAAAGLFRVPQTPEPSQVAGGAGVKPEPEPSPQKVLQPPPQAQERAPLPSQAAALAHDAADRPGRGGKKKAPRKKPTRFAQNEDALKILPPTVSVNGSALESFGLSTRHVAPPESDLPPVSYLCRYRFPAGLPADEAAPRTEAFVRTVRDDLAARGIALERWDLVPPAGEGRATTLRLRLVVPPEVVASLSRDRWVPERERPHPLGGGNADLPAPASSASRLPPAARAAPPAAPTAPSSASPNPDGSLLLTLSLPASCLGPTPDAAKARRAFLSSQARALAMQGKAVLATRVDEERGTCEVRYLPPEEEEEEGDDDGEEEGMGEKAGEMLPPASREPAAPGGGRRAVHGAQDDVPAPAAGAAQQVAAPVAMDEDVKPVIAPPSPAPAPAPVPQPQPQPARDDRMDVDGEAEVDQLATPTPEPEGGAASARRFPLRMLAESRADSKETFEVVDAFIKEYFRRFDESRGTLEYLYTPNALFSLKLDPTIPARLRAPPRPFEPRWLMAANRLSSTPVAITNAIRALPPGSHDLARMVFTARSVPELHVRKQARAPVLLHLTGEFEEFPDKTVRSFARTFIIVPKGASAGARAGALTAADGGEYWIHSDQLTVKYHVPGEPKPLPVAYPPFSPSKARANAAPPQIRPTPAAAAAPLAARAGAAARPFAQFAPHPGLARVQPQPAPAPAPAAPTPQAQAQAAQDAARDRALQAAHADARERARAQALALSAARPTPPQQPPQEKKRRRASSASPGLREVQHGEEDDDGVLVLSDSSASASAASRSPELQRKRRAPSPSGSSSAPAAAKRRVSGPSSGPSTAVAAAEAGLSRAEVERLIQQEVAAQVQRIHAAAGRAVSPRSDAEEPAPGGALASTAGKKRTKERTREREAELAREKEEARRKAREREKEKERKEKEKRERERAKEPELGTGLGKTDARILLPGGGNAQLHGFDGRSNKLRHMIDTGSSFLAVSHVGDIVEFACHATTLSSTVRKLHSSKDDKFRVDDFAWSDAKDTLLVGYLGAKEGKAHVRPPNQVILYRREESNAGSSLIASKLDERPHVAGGVTAISTIPGTGRLRFITGGEDKKLFLWTRSRATQEITTANIRSEHSSMITSITPIEYQNWVVSGGKDKRVFAYDLDRMASTWQALLNSPVMTVSQVPSDPHLILARVSAPSSQFTVFDIRSAKKGVLSFGYDLAPHTSSTGALSPTTMGRYYRGDQCDTIYAFPDYENGVKLWDLRNVRETLSDRDLKKQHLPSLGRSKVVQTAFRGRGELCLMEMAHFSRLSIRG
ncbi:hypothetical protein JCM10450v2_004439 [Rhodotorula kratochvilovae]